MEPKVLLLDEPMAGMNVEEKEDMVRFILDVNDQWGTTIILIEHDMGVVMDISTGSAPWISASGRGGRRPVQADQGRQRLSR
jgi:ABC-type methionine transport system ATPase subunit